MSKRRSDQTTSVTIGQAVAVLQDAYPDVSHSSLRFLEREGLLTPVRTSGGHRMYRQSDVDRVRRIKEWQANRLSLDEIRQRLAELDASASPAELAQRFLDLALQGEMAAATRVVLHADDLGMPVSCLLDEVLRPALVDVGERWHHGSLTVSEEHEISELARDLIAELTIRHARPSPGQPVLLAACVAKEQHDLGLRMVIGLLRQRGAQVHFLGASVSPEFLVESVRLRQPDVVLLSVSLEEHHSALAATLDALGAATPGAHSMRIVAGGRGCQQYRDELHQRGVAVVDAQRLEHVVDQILS